MCCLLLFARARLVVWFVVFYLGLLFSVDCCRLCVLIASVVLICLSLFCVCVYVVCLFDCVCACLFVLV